MSRFTPSPELKLIGVINFGLRNFWSPIVEKPIAQVEMASVILGSTEEVKKKPIFTIVVCLTSPLTQAKIRVEELNRRVYQITIGICYNIPLPEDVAQEIDKMAQSAQKRAIENVKDN